MKNLKPFQEDAVKRMKDGCILVGGVGSGKSRTSIAYYICSTKNSPKELYIITTAKKRDSHEWEEELELMGAKAVSIDSWNNIKKYVEVKNAFFIFDEQRVVGYGSWTKSFLKIAKFNRWILLSATPADNWMDLIPVFIANGFYRNKTDFCDQHVIWSRFSKFPQVKGYMNEGRLIRYKHQIMVKMDYRRSTQVHHQNILVEYDDILYKIVKDKRWDPFDEKPIENVSQCCYLLRKIVNSDPSRIDAVYNLMMKHQRVIIFYKYDFELELLRDFMKEEHIMFAEWNGHKHEPVPEGERWAYLVQYTSGCEGWCCTVTDTIIFYCDDYSYKVMVQAAGRIDRMNTPYTDLYYYHLHSGASIDRAISRSLKMKKKFNETDFLSPKINPQDLQRV